MRIECERCHSAYTIDDSQLDDRPVGAQCPFCRHVQVVQRAQPASEGGDQDLVLEPHNYSSSLEPPPQEGPSESSREDNSMLQLGAMAEFAFEPTERGSSGATVVNELPPDVEPSHCVVCGTLLTDPFDQVLGLCEAHQKERQEPDGDLHHPPDKHGWYAEYANGEVFGPISLEEIRNRIRGRSIPIGAGFSNDGETFKTIYEFKELGYLANLQVGDARSTNTRRLASLRHYVSMVLIPVVLLGGIGSAAYLFYENRQQVVDLYHSLISEAPPDLDTASPLRRFLAQWAIEATGDADSVDELLRKAWGLQDKDEWTAYEQAEGLYRQALVIDEHNPQTLARYVENFVLWRYAVARPDERALMRQVLEYAKKMDASSNDVHRALGTMAWVSNDLDGCRSGADTALRINKRDARAQLLLASCYLEGNPELAESDISYIRREHPRLMRVTRVLVQAYLRQGKYGDAFDILNERLNQEPNNASLQLVYGQLEQAIGRYEKAKSRYQRALSLRGDRQQAYLLLAMLHVRQNRFGGAAKLFEKAVDAGYLAPERGAILYADWARAELSRKKVSRAIILAEQALKLAPQDVASMVVLGDAYISHGDLDRASEMVHRALNIQMDDVDDPMALILAGRVASAQGNISTAIQHFRAAMKGLPKDPRLIAILASEYLRAGQSAQAYATMRKAVDLEPKHAFYAGDRMALTLSSQVLREALKPFKQSARDPRNASVANSAMALLHIHLGQEQEAEKFVRRALKVDDANAFALLLTTYFAAKNEAWQRTENGANLVLLVERGNAVAHLYRAQAHRANGRLAEARADYQSALRNQPGLLTAEVELALLNYEDNQIGSDKLNQVLKRVFSLASTSIPVRRMLLEHMR